MTLRCRETCKGTLGWVVTVVNSVVDSISVAVWEVWYKHSISSSLSSTDASECKGLDWPLLFGRYSDGAGSI